MFRHCLVSLTIAALFFGTANAASRESSLELVYDFGDRVTYFDKATLSNRPFLVISFGPDERGNYQIAGPLTLEHSLLDYCQHRQKVHGDLMCRTGNTHTHLATAILHESIAGRYEDLSQRSNIAQLYTTTTPPYTTTPRRTARVHTAPQLFISPQTMAARHRQKATREANKMLRWEADTSQSSKSAYQASKAEAWVIKTGLSLETGDRYAALSAYKCALDHSNLSLW